MSILLAPPPAKALPEPDWTPAPGLLFRRDIISRYQNHPGITPGPASALCVAVAQCDHVALIAVSRAVRELGLDLERVQHDIPFDEMAGGFLDPRSQWDLRITWSRQEKAWKFFQFWTSNEACAKTQPFSRSPSHVNGFSPEPDFIAALAVQGGPEPEFRYWDWQC
jgi:hypothetical protein